MVYIHLGRQGGWEEGCFYEVAQILEPPSVSWEWRRVLRGPKQKGMQSAGGGVAEATWRVSLGLLRRGSGAGLAGK